MNKGFTLAIFNSSGISAAEIDALIKKVTFSIYIYTYIIYTKGIYDYVDSEVK